MCIRDSVNCIAGVFRNFPFAAVHSKIFPELDKRQEKKYNNFIRSIAADWLYQAIFNENSEGRKDKGYGIRFDSIGKKVEGKY